MYQALAATKQDMGRTVRQRWLAVLLPLVVAMSVTACTAGFVYNRVHWVVSWYVNGLVSLDEPQEQRLRDIIQRTMDWHRQTQLPKYVALLDELDRQTDGVVTPEDMEARYQEMSALFDVFLRHVIPDAAGLLGTLSPEQVSELAANLEEDNEELWDEYAGSTPETRAKRRTKSALRVLQRLTGKLDQEQRAGVEARLATMNDLSDEWMERRRHWQARLVELLRSRPSADRLEAALRDLALDPNQFDTPRYREGVEENRRIIVSMVADVTNSLNDRQRAHLGRKFVEYRDDLQAIIDGR